MYRLCLAGHGLHPDEIREKLSGDQVAGWKAFGLIEPFGPAAIERLAAIIAHTVELNARKSPRRLDQFMPSECGRVMTAEEIHATLKGFSDGASG